jgi:hypothetical protein
MMISEISTSRKPAQMVWASVWLDERGRPRRSKLIIMQRNINAPKGGYSTVTTQARQEIRIWRGLTQRHMGVRGRTVT